MANFKTVFPFIQEDEGGINRNPDDNAAKYPAPNTNGAHTNKGVTYETFVSHAAKLGYVVSSALFLQMPQWIVDGIAKMTFWDSLKLDKINSNKKAYLLCDFSFNSGPFNATQQAQIALGIPADGIAGPQFIASVNNTNENTFGDLLTFQRVQFITNSGKIKASLKPGLISRVQGTVKKKFQPLV